MTPLRIDLPWTRLTKVTDEQIATALTWSCDVCKAPKDQLCTNTIRPGEPLPGRLVHFARLTDRRREPKQ